LWPCSSLLSLGFSLCTPLLPAKQDKPWWIPLWAHSLLAKVARFQTPTSFFGPGKKNLLMHVKKTILILCCCFFFTTGWSSDSICTWYCGFWVDVAVTHWHRSLALLDL
jgi:hypothetical protein